MTSSQNPNAPNAVPPISSSDVSLGIFTTVGIVILLWGYCWLKGNTSLNEQRVNVIFDEVAGLHENAPVYVDGVHVGTVYNIDWLGEHRVLVNLHTNSSILKIPVGAKFEILTNGIVGAKYVQIDMPEDSANNPNLPLLDEHSVVHGEHPVRPELAVNKLAITLSDIDMQAVGHTIEADRKRIVRAADQLSILADKAMPVIDHALPLEENVTALSIDLRRTSKKMAAVFDNPRFSSNLKDAAKEAKETAENIRAAIHELNTTLADKPLRQDVLQSLHELNQSTANVAKSLNSLQEVTSDHALRSDMLKILSDIHSDLNEVNDILSKPMTSDLRGTLNKTNDLIDHLDLAARQMNQILNERAPLLHLMFGRPGRISTAEPPVKNSNAEEGQAAGQEIKVDQIRKDETRIAPGIDQSTGSDPSRIEQKPY